MSALLPTDWFHALFPGGGLGYSVSAPRGVHDLKSSRGLVNGGDRPGNTGKAGTILLECILVVIVNYGQTSFISS